MLIFFLKKHMRKFYVTIVYIQNQEIDILKTIVFLYAI